MINIPKLIVKDVDSNSKMLFNTKVEKTDFGKVIITDWILVDDFSAMRMDIISKAAYGTTDYIQEITKFNGLKDAKSIKAGDVLAIPDLTSFRTHTKTRTLKPIQLQNTSILGRLSGDAADLVKSGSSNPKSTPSKKSKPSANFTKKDNGILIF